MVIDTDIWLDHYFFEPLKLCKQIKKYFSDLTELQILQLLQEKGLYQPSVFTKHSYEQLKKQNIWVRFRFYEQKYKKLWNGPDIPLFIFPCHHSIFSSIRKNGFTFPDKVLFFLTPLEDNEEYEALFVHEYHHACRLAGIGKPIEEATLLDSLIMEGLAEHAVRDYCGEKYIARQKYNYKEKEILYFCQKVFKNNLHKKISDPIHNQLLYGYGLKIPPFIGYLTGYYLIDLYRNKMPFSIKDTLNTASEQFLTVVKEDLP
ncbi:DUF2268 domain-containing protein [Bacillus kwashiorkori]|uniref:DUF2268 domain-containing protein n=1 Tax=Bacillus kwashiorkori TaxID=1522318 RepID=UPI0007812DBA|nr:DUF2268 domain-containing putative Zn-dependent protease [Bacillus kwashiorkori]